MNFEISTFECSDSEGTKIVFTKMQKETALLFMTKVLNRWGNWGSNTKTVLETSGPGFNDTWQLTLVVPPVKRGTPLKLTREEVYSFFAGIVDQFKHRDYKQKIEEFRLQVFPTN